MISYVYTKYMYKIVPWKNFVIWKYIKNLHRATVVKKIFALSHDTTVFSFKRNVPSDFTSIIY